MKRRKKIRKHRNKHLKLQKIRILETLQITPTLFGNGMTADEFDKWLDYLELNKYGCIQCIYV